MLVVGSARIPTAPPTPASSNGSVETKLGTSVVTLTSSTDTDLRLKVRAVRLTPDSAAPTTTLDVTVSIGSLESHNWAIPVADGDFVDDETTGAASIGAPNSELGSYGQITLTATPVGSPTTRLCGDGSSETVQNEAVGGSVDFSTGSAAVSPWGELSDSHVAFSGQSHLVQEFGTADDPCFDPPSGLANPCTLGIEWSAPYDATGTISGGWRTSPHGVNGQVDATNTVSLAQAGSPTAVRTDTDSRAVPIPITEVFTGQALMAVTGNPSQSITGSATVRSASGPVVRNDDCPAALSQVNTRSFDSAIQPGPHPLTIKQAIGGPIILSRQPHGAEIRFVHRVGQPSLT